jgi:hypothetical protein
MCRPEPQEVVWYHALLPFANTFSLLELNKQEAKVAQVFLRRIELLHAGVINVHLSR